jgi:hypothetical protein
MGVSGQRHAPAALCSRFQGHIVSESQGCLYAFQERSLPKFYMLILLFIFILYVHIVITSLIIQNGLCKCAVFKYRVHSAILGCDLKFESVI